MARVRIPHEVDNAIIDENTQGRPEISVFAKTLNNLLIEKGIHQDDLAEALGISSGSISSYRNGKKEPRLSMIVKIADYLGVDCHYLMTGIRAKSYICAEDTGLSESGIQALRNLKQMPFTAGTLNYVVSSKWFEQIIFTLFNYRERLKEAVRLADNPAAEQQESWEVIHQAEFMEFAASKNLNYLFKQIFEEEISKSSVIKKSFESDKYTWQWKNGGKNDGKR